MRNRRTNRLITVGGRTQCVAAWGEEVGLASHLITGRLKNGWTPEAAVLTPVDMRFSRKRVRP